jgi:hypothetical protein
VNFRPEMGGKKDRVHTVQSDMDFKVYVVMIVGAEGMKTKTGFILDLGVPESDQSMETVIFW